MYVKRIQLHNYGPISQLDLACPFDEEDKPKPIVLVGANGSGKSIVLAHIVNGLLSAQQIVYPENQEVDEGTVYKFRTARYIQSGREYSFSRVDFENDLYISELQLQREKQAYSRLPAGIAEIGAQDEWDSMLPEMDDVILGTIEPNQKTRIEGVFSTRCVLYFPPNRFEEPAWLNQKNLKSKAQFTNPTHIQGDTNRKVINYSPLHDNQNWLFDVVHDCLRFEIKAQQETIIDRLKLDKSQMTAFDTTSNKLSGKAQNLYDTAIKIIQTMAPHAESVRFRFGMRTNRVLSVAGRDEMQVPNIFQLSSGETSLLNLFLSILRDHDLCKISFDKPEDIRGIVVVDEIDLHLHSQHQHEILPNLMKIFPRVQFVVTTHSPLFVLGLQRVFGDDGFVVHHLPQGGQIGPEEFNEFGKAYRLFSHTRKHFDTIATEIKNSRRPIIFVDGKTDVAYFTRAIKLLGIQKTFQDIEIRDGAGQLKNIWRGLTRDHTEHRVIILLHDCDDKVEFGEWGNVFRWTIPQIESHPIQKGIENRFSRETLEKVMKHKPAFVDIKGEYLYSVRGVHRTSPEQWAVNPDEKVNLCNWLCENGTETDFKDFQEIFNKLRKLPKLFQSDPD